MIESGDLPSDNLEFAASLSALYRRAPEEAGEDAVAMAVLARIERERRRRRRTLALCAAIGGVACAAAAGTAIAAGGGALLDFARDLGPPPVGEWQRLTAWAAPLVAAALALAAASNALRRG